MYSPRPPPIIQQVEHYPTYIPTIMAPRLHKPYQNVEKLREQK